MAIDSDSVPMAGRGVLPIDVSHMRTAIPAQELLTGLPLLDLDGLRANLALAVLILSVLCLSASSFALVFLAVAVLDGVFKCSTIAPLLVSQSSSLSVRVLTDLEEVLKIASRWASNQSSPSSVILTPNPAKHDFAALSKSSRKLKT